jgi:hypothetical protein
MIRMVLFLFIFTEETKTQNMAGQIVSTRRQFDNLRIFYFINTKRKAKNKQGATPILIVII